MRAGTRTLWLTTTLITLSAIACQPPDDPSAAASGTPSTPTAELHRATEPDRVLSAARALIAADTNAALITVDEEGRPRARTVTTSRPDSAFTIWIATRPETRKVEQLRRHDRVTLYYNDDDAGTYLSIMGTATLHDDLATKRAHNFYSEERTREYWPDYPEGMLLIEIRPDWLEMVGPGVPAQEVTWRPQAVDLMR